MRDSYEQGNATSGNTRPANANTAVTRPATNIIGGNTGNVYNSTVVRQPAVSTTTNVVRGPTANYATSQIVRGPVTTTGSVVRQSHLNPGYATTTTTTGSIVRPSQTYTVGNTGSRVVNGQWTSTVYAPETYQVGTYDSQID